MTPPDVTHRPREMTVADRLRPSDDHLRRVLEQHAMWVESHGRDGVRADLSELDLSGTDLSGAVLVSARLNGTVLTRAKLNGADLSGAYLVGATLVGAELNLANLTAARLSEANLTSAELCRADLSGAYLERANLERANLSQAVLVAADLTAADLTGANLSRADLERAELTRVNFAGADLERATLKQASAPRANFAGAQFTDADLAAVNLTRANFCGADLTRANLAGANLHHTDLSRARIKAARLENADLRAARLPRLDQAFVRGAQFSALSSRWRVFLCEIVLGPLALWLDRRGWEKVAHGVRFTADHNDPWTVLRQSYAGPRVTFLFFTVILFALPYVGKAAVYSAAGPVEQQLAEQAAVQRAAIQARLAEEPENTELRADLARLDRLLARFEKKPVWMVLLNWDRGKLWPTILAGLLILYNVGVYWLITRVSSLRDEEERSGWTPAWRDYGYLVAVHRVVVILFYVSWASFLLNIAGMLGEEVLVPKLR